MDVRFFKKTLSALGPVIGLLFVFGLFAAISPSAFTSFYNIKTILTQSVIIGIAALGMTFVIIARGIDLSVGSQIALATVVVAIVLRAADGSMGSDTGLDAGLGMGFAIPLMAAIAGIAACGVTGAISGTVVTRFRIVPFIVTLGTMQVARGIAKWIGAEQTVTAPDNWLNGLMLIDPDPGWLLLAPGVWLGLLLLLVAAGILRHTVLGRYTFAIGSNEETARLCGIKVDRIKIIIYTLCGVFTGIAGVMQFGYLTVGDPTSAVGLELDIIAAVVIGGGSLNGGEGSALGSIVGALIMAVLRNGSNMLGLPNYVQEIIIGVIIVGAVMVDQMRVKSMN